eukprot:2345888-Prymnesium_polylepis.1
MSSRQCASLMFPAFVPCAPRLAEDESAQDAADHLHRRPEAGGWGGLRRRVRRTSLRCKR